MDFQKDMRVVLRWLATFLCGGLLGLTPLWGQQAISVFRVPLVCGAAPDIGCGSRSKPLLLALESHSEIAEARIAYDGTRLAVRWALGEAAPEVVQAVFASLGLGQPVLVDESLKEGFGRSSQWLRHDEVDRLSLIEAGRIAEKLLTGLIADGYIQAGDREAAKARVEEFFAADLVRLRQPDEVSAPQTLAYWQQQVEALLEPFWVDGRRPSNLFRYCRSECSEQKDACCAKGKPSCTSGESNE